MSEWIEEESRRKYHEVANLFPLIHGEEFDNLKEDIATNGILESIWIDKEGSIVDGRNRHRACCETGVRPVFRTWCGEGSLVSFVVSLNLHRRHLTSGQRAMLAVDLLPLYEKEAKERQVLLAGTRPSTDLSQKIEQGISGEDENDNKKWNSSKSASQAAEATKSNRQYVNDAKRIADKVPEVADKVRSGELTIPEAKSLAKMEEPQRVQAIQLIEEGESVKDAVKAISRQERVENIVAISAGNKEIDTFSGPFNVIYADPAWKYEYSATDSRMIENQYPTMELSEICDLPVDSIADDDAVLFLWTTSPKLLESMKVIESWKFNYRTCMVWDKERIGMGYYARQQHELLLIATRGSLPVPEPSSRPPSVIRVARDEKHSAKPCEFYEIIEQMYPEYPRVELFARVRRDGWSAWGNQA